MSRKTWVVYIPIVCSIRRLSLHNNRSIISIETHTTLPQNRKEVRFRQWSLLFIVQTNHSGKATLCAGVATRRGSRRTDLAVKSKIATKSPGVKTGLSSLGTKIISDGDERQGQENPVLTLCYPHALLRCTGVS